MYYPIFGSEMKVKTQIVLGVFVWIGFFSACTEYTKEATNSQEYYADGLSLLESNCFSCHNPNGKISNQVAPSMAAIKKVYITENTTKEEFLQVLSAFLLHPSVDKSKMLEAVAKFGLMPKIVLSKTQRAQIATYIYDKPLEQKDWHAKHSEEKHEKQKNKNNGALTPIERAKHYAKSTKYVLGKNLLNAINTYGTAGAISFCNTKALALTDSMADQFDVRIHRVTDRPRNPKNQATPILLHTIEAYKHQLSEGEKLAASSINIRGKNIYCIPIVTNAMCLKCHGGKEIDNQTRQKLIDLYPSDQGTGYAENELRGIWVIEGLE